MADNTPNKKAPSLIEFWKVCDDKPGYFLSGLIHFFCLEYSFINCIDVIIHNIHDIHLKILTT